MQIQAFRYTETNITRFLLGFHTVGSTNVSCRVFLSSNAHRLVWIASRQVPQGFPTHRQVWATKGIRNDWLYGINHVYPRKLPTL